MWLHGMQGTTSWRSIRACHQAARCGLNAAAGKARLLAELCCQLRQLRDTCTGSTEASMPLATWTSLGTAAVMPPCSAARRHLPAIPPRHGFGDCFGVAQVRSTSPRLPDGTRSPTRDFTTLGSKTMIAPCEREFQSRRFRAHCLTWRRCFPPSASSGRLSAPKSSSCSISVRLTTFSVASGVILALAGCGEPSRSTHAGLHPLGARAALPPALT